MASNCIVLTDSILTGATLSASGTASGYDTRHLTDWMSYTYWRSPAGPQHAITIDCGAARAADTIGLAVHNITAQGGTVSLYASNDPAFGSGTVEVIPPFTPADQVVLQRFATQTARYWQLRIGGITSDVYLAVLVIGIALVMDDHIDGEYTPASEDPKLAVERSQTGAILGAVYSHTTLDAKYRFKYLSDTWYRDQFLPVWRCHLSKGFPFFIAPDTALSSDAYLMMLNPGSGIDPRYDTAARRSITLEMIGVLHE